jgi:hypothetical protein
MKRSTQWAARRLPLLVAVAAAAAMLAAPGALAVHGGDREVTVGSNDNFFSRNKQNEPAIAVNPVSTNILAAGANDNIDMELCNAGDDTTCPFTPNVGGTGIQFSFNAGDTWVQPTYTGLSARHCTGAPGPDDPDCVAQQGPIGTLPRYDEMNLVSDGDPAVAWGPKPSGNGHFTYANGARLYVANLASSVSADLGEPSFKGFEAIAVSRTDDVAAAAAGNESAWMRPVIASQRQSAVTFADKEQIWADNAETSPFFGNVYVCFAQFRGPRFAAAPLTVARSTNGGDTWTQRQVTPAHNAAPSLFGQSGCTVRTDSRGVVYVFYEQFQNPEFFLPPRGLHLMVKSFDGGRRWTRPQTLFRITDPCFFVDPVIDRCVMDGVAGARDDLAAAPSVDIANGAPSGVGATNEIVDVWADARDGLNNEDVMLSYSTDGGGTWSGPTRISNAPDRGYYAAPALSPDGQDLYVVYNAFTTPFRDNTTDPRSLVGVVLHFDIGAGGTPVNRAEVHRGVPGDPRGSSQNNPPVAEFLGDYVYATATNDYGAAVWNDARNATVCPAMNAWRAALRAGENPPQPRPNIDCAPTFGNTDIFGWSGADPTP